MMQDAWVICVPFVRAKISPSSHGGSAPSTSTMGGLPFGMGIALAAWRASAGVAATSSLPCSVGFVALVVQRPSLLRVQLLVRGSVSDSHAALSASASLDRPRCRKRSASRAQTWRARALGSSVAVEPPW
jgi:hypothetical protein